MRQRSVLKVIILLIGVALATLGPAGRALGATPAQTRSCVMACNPVTRACSLFERARVPSGYVRVSRLLYGYKRVKSNSSCENVICVSRSTTCTPWSPRP